MDWCLPPDHAAASELRLEVAAYLTRHATPESDIQGAELAFSELLTNAVEHSGNTVWVSLDWTGAKPVVTVHDLGPSFEVGADLQPAEPLQVGGMGLMIASHLTEALAVAAKRAGGNRVTATLNVERPSAESHDPVRTLGGRVPTLDEAVDGFFERDSFLRALTVEIAHVVDSVHGPSVAEAAIAQVGANVGGRMEDAYRIRRKSDGDLSPGEIAEFYVQLKAAIGGDFYVVSVDDDKIVLGNRRCPFGDAVRQAPSLCRMTSSVFGGIAVRNARRPVAVHLEERIAVGDPECRVTVWLNPPPADASGLVHHYVHSDA